MLKINMKNTNKEIFTSFDKNLIYKEMVKTISLHEIKMYQARVDRTKTKMQRYFNSTPLRNVFARICNYAYTVNQFIQFHLLPKSLEVLDRRYPQLWINVKMKDGKIFTEEQITLRSKPPKSFMNHGEIIFMQGLI